MDLKEKSDIEIMAIMHDLEQKMAQVQQALNLVRAEAMRRIEEHKKNTHETNQ